jgi:hypothetical protein
MIEALVLAAKEAAKEGLREVAETSLKEGGIKSIFSSMENSLESLRAENLSEPRPLQNWVDGMRREAEAGMQLMKEFPENKGFVHHLQAYLRDISGNIVKDSESGMARRIDHLIEQKNQIIKSFEITSETASKIEQLGREMRIREQGGNFIKALDGTLREIPSSVQTEVWRIR